MNRDVVPRMWQAKCPLGIIDLHGSRKRGEKAPLTKDEPYCLPENIEATP